MIKILLLNLMDFYVNLNNKLEEFNHDRVILMNHSVILPVYLIQKLIELFPLIQYE